MPTTTYSFGDVVTVDYPFTNQSGQRRRPAVIVSSRRFHASGMGDYILMPITGNIRKNEPFGSTVVQDWKGSGLLSASVIKPILWTFEEPEIAKKIGRLDAKTRPMLLKNLGRILGGR